MPLMHCVSQKRVGDHYECSECETHFYLGMVPSIIGFIILKTKTQCFPQMKVDNCLRYYKKQLGCDVCKENHIKVNIGLCEPLDFQIENCDVYVNQSVCSWCIPEFYLQNNMCFPVDPKNIIPNCKYYSSPTLVSLTSVKDASPITCS
jgi:hypothetical protein